MAWIVSHAMKYPLLPVMALLASIINNFSYSGIQAVIGRGFDVIVVPGFQVSDLFAIVVFIGILAGGRVSSDSSATMR